MAFITPVINIESRHTVGEAASSFFIYSLCLEPFAHSLALTVPYLFSVRKMSEGIAYCFSSSVNESASMGKTVCKSWICISSHVIVITLFFLKFCNPILIPYWIMV